MSEFIKLSEAATIGIHAMMFLAGHPSRPVTTREITEILQVSEAHLAKVFQRLGKAGLVKAVRGPQGGYSLAGSTETINLLQIFEAIDGQTSPRDCLLSHPVCHKTCCGIGPVIGQMNRKLAEHLRNTRLADVADYFQEEGAQS
jgi:Rrf2 family protein